jgi:EVE domain
MASSWIFQGNPKHYDVVGAVRALPTIKWWVRQYARRIEAGDTAYMWETGGTGFVARAIVSGDPAPGYDDDDEEDPFRRSARDPGLGLYAPLAITEVFDPPISRAC